ncbi:uncharacterized protein LOC126827070 [Patella vulgata]|uniref:uncharacterized protein LOC126827070 n=1 Tax=Patella vulgata TaxID=6465 RepID=UPI00217FA9CC|nr:uncharacterized protein LOC126827070 [Patella vulgata]
MLLYVQNKSFPLRTFVLSVKNEDKVARVRAQLLHILYELGKDHHQFRLRYRGEILRDADYLGDYQIGDNCVITMVPMVKKLEFDGVSVSSSQTNYDSSSGQPPDIKDALNREVKHFDQREKFLNDFKALLYIHSLLVFLALMSVYWYSAAWTGCLFVVAIIFVPSYSRLGGFVGNNTHLRKYYCVGFGIGGLICLGVAICFSVITWTRIVNHGCKDWMFVDDCSHQQVFSALLYTVHSLLFIVSVVVIWILLINFRVEVGDFIEKYLVQERDIEKVVSAAKNGSTKVKRQAAYELATMAASSDDNKLMIAAEGGLLVLESLALCRDSATQEHAIEALAELLIIPSMQDTFVKMGGCRSLSAALHSSHSRAVQEAANAIYIIVSESEENKNNVIADRGIEDLAHVAYEGNTVSQRTIASIFLELAFNNEIRSQLTSSNIPAQALTSLCENKDMETKRYSLQALELMAIESSDMICAQENLLNILLEVPFKTMDEKLYLLAGKILMYYAENPETCEQLLDNSNVKESLGLFARTDDPVLQKVVSKIIFCTLETKELKMRALHLKLDRVLDYIKEHAADRETWDMADQALNDMNSSDDLNNLPTLSTLEKLKKMESKDKFGSSSSVGSEVKGQDSFTSSNSDLKK